MDSQLTPPENPPDTLPRSFGRFDLFDQIGRGGMANIYLARARTDIGGSKRVVIKEIFAELANDEEFARMLVAEARLAAELHHPNVVQVFDLGSEDGRLYMAMEYVEGLDLNELLKRLSKRGAGLPLEFALQVVREVLFALEHAHAVPRDAGPTLTVIHRDLSPANVLLSFDGEVKLCDFGIARAYTNGVFNEILSPTRARIAGKSAYMSPEQARGEEIDVRSDLYATGVLLWELCAGRRMIRGTDEEMLERARRGDVPPFPALGLPAEDALRDVLAKALSYDRDARFQTAREFEVTLSDYAHLAGMTPARHRLARFVRERFGEEILSARREKERALAPIVSVMPPSQPEGAPLESERPKIRVSSAPPARTLADRIDGIAADEKKLESLRQISAPAPEDVIPSDTHLDTKAADPKSSDDSTKTEQAKTEKVADAVITRPVRRRPPTAASSGPSALVWLLVALGLGVAYWLGMLLGNLV